MSELVFDIETVPQTTALSDIQTEEFNRKLETYMKGFGPNPEDSVIEEAKRLLMGTNPYYGEIICIGLGYESSDGTMITKGIVGNEKDILIEFWKLISNKSFTFISYNGLEFDVPFIVSRSMKHKIAITNKAFLDTRRYQRYPHFDVKQIMSDWDRYRSCTLHLACDHVGIPSPKTGEIKAKDVAQAFADGRIEEIKKYCLRDVEATLKLYNIMKQYCSQK